MKKSIILFAIALALTIAACSKSGAAAGSSDSDEKKAIAAVEKYFNCIGNDDFVNIKKYANSGGVDIAMFINAFSSEADKELMKNYKVDVVEVEFENNNYYITVNCVSGTERIQFIKENNIWLVNDFIAKTK